VLVLPLRVLGASVMEMSFLLRAADGYWWQQLVLL
jgi:hypothetical protein